MNMDIENDDGVQDEHADRNTAQAAEDAADVEYFSSINTNDIINWDDSPHNPLNSGDWKQGETVQESDEIIRRSLLDGVVCAVEGCGRQAIREHGVVTLEDFTDYAKWPKFALCGEHSAQIEALRATDEPLE